MAKLNIFWTYSLFLSIYKLPVYVDGERRAKIGNCKMISLTLTPGRHEIKVSCAYFGVFNRKNGMHSNIISLDVEEGKEYNLTLSPHPLFWWGKHYPAVSKLFTPVECLLLTENKKGYQDKLKQMDSLSRQTEKEVGLLKYHPATWLLILSLSLIAIISNIVQPHLYGLADGAAFIFGAAALLGLFSGRGNKRILARGWEYKMMFYNAIGIFLVVLTMPAGFYWEKLVYFAFLILAVLWGMSRLKHWPEKIKPLEDLEDKVAALEQSL